MEFIDPAHATAAVSADLSCSGVIQPGSSEVVETALSAWRQALSRGHYHLPLFLAMDLAALVAEGLGVRFVSEEKGRAPDCSARLRYEREILVRLLQTSCVMEACDLVKPGAGSIAARRHFLELMLERFAPHWPRHCGLSPGAVRHLSADDVQAMSVDASALAALYPALPSSVDQLNAFVSAACHEIQWSRLLQAEDMFELTHIEHLGAAHLRMGCRQILGLARELADARPPACDLREHDADTDTAFIDETTYPTGGFTGLTNQGSFENLLTSELAYMDPVTAGISLFDLRFVEGELLFYLRDDGTMRRRRRTIHFIIDLHECFSLQPPGSRHQYSIIAQALCLRLKEDLTALFESDALLFSFHILPTVPAELREAESGILRVLLADDMAHGVARLSLPVALRPGELIDPQRKSYAVIFTTPERATDWNTRLSGLLEGQCLHHSIVALGDAQNLSHGKTKDAIQAQLIGSSL